MKIESTVLLAACVFALSGCGSGKSNLTPEEAAALGRSADSIRYWDNFTFQLVSGPSADFSGGAVVSGDSFIYEKNRPAPKDRLKLAAGDEAAMLQNASAALNARFGLSQERSYELAKLAVIWTTTPKERKNLQTLNKISMQVFGHSVSEIQSAVVTKLSGQDDQLNQIIEDAALMNGITPENMNQILDNMLGQSR